MGKINDLSKYEENGRMTQQCNKYTQKFIGQFIDNELGPDKTRELSSHIEHCPDCAGQAARLKKLKVVFNRHVTAQIDKIKLSDGNMAPTPIDQKIDSKKGQGFFDRFFDGKTDHLYVKLASLGAVAALLILAIFQGALPPVTPSAIVKSLDTNASSVMIIETLKEKHTIIWFSET